MIQNMESNKQEPIKNTKGLVVVTGCDTGIGKSLVEILVQRGYSVAASYLEESQLETTSNIFSKKMDIRNPEEVQNFCGYIMEMCSKGNKLQALISNAGVALGGPIENIPLALYRKSFEINFFGALKIIQTLTPELIKNKGRIIVIGSMAGKIAMPFLSPYVSTKFALEGFCDSLRREMNPWGVKVTIIEPAAVATPIWNKAKKQNISFVDEKYMSSLHSFQDNFIEGGNKGMDQKTAATKIADILETERPKARYIIAKDVLRSKLLLLLPSIILDKAVKKLFKMNYGG